jgi:hypothetical protein
MLRAIRADPAQFMLRCHIEDAENKRRRVGRFWPEQKLWVRALIESPSRQILGLKPRQMGFTTMTLLFTLWKAITSREPTKTLQIVHEDQAVFRLKKMLDVAIEELPREVRPALKVSNRDTTIFARHKDGQVIDGPQFTRMLAGGSGQARSWTYNNIIATEMAHWRRATAHAPDHGDAMSADEEAFSSALATKHDKLGHIVVESTGNGPAGLFHKLYLNASRARQNDLQLGKWTFVFIPWRAVSRYRLPLTDEEMAQFEKTLTDEEVRLRDKHQLRLDQLAWRRWKKLELGLSDLAWRRNYPLVADEPFLLDVLTWFDQVRLSEQRTYAEEMVREPIDDADERADPLTIHWQPEEGRRYLIGGDTSGGVGQDEACFQVFRDDLLHVATWASNRYSPPQQAMACHQLAQRYGGKAGSGVLTLIEENHYGKQVIDKLYELNGNRVDGVCKLWKGPAGRNFWTDHASKRTIFTHARDLLDASYPILQDLETIDQLRQMVEKKEGVIEARVGHDDRAMACVLGLFCWLKLQLDAPADADTTRENIARILNLWRIAA